VNSPPSAPILAALEVLEDSDRRQEGDSAEAVLTRRALTACPITISRLDPQTTKARGLDRATEFHEAVTEAEYAAASATSTPHPRGS
jgi:hypothetical protein